MYTNKLLHLNITSIRIYKFKNQFLMITNIFHKTYSNSKSYTKKKKIVIILLN